MTLARRFDAALLGDGRSLDPLVEVEPADDHDALIPSGTPVLPRMTAPVRR